MVVAPRDAMLAPLVAAIHSIFIWRIALPDSSHLW